MNKNFKFYLSVWAVLFILFQVVTFVPPSEVAGMNKFGGAFWIGYLFITAALIGQLAVGYYTFQEKNLQKLFYKISLIQISWTGLILMFVFGTVCMVVPNMPNWLGIVACCIVLGFCTISLVKANMAAEMVSEIDEKIKTKTAFVKMLTADAEHLMRTAKTPELRAAAKKVYEAVRYSDPVSHVELVETEMEIERTFALFLAAVQEENIEKSTELSSEIISLVDLRNKKCRVIK